MRLLATCILFERDQKELFENPRNCLISIKSLLSIDLYTVVSVRTRIRAIRGSAGTPSVKTCTCTRCNRSNSIRTQYVSFASTTSTTMQINYGIPQGSILGPLFFLIYINNLPSCLDSTPRFFVDDSALLITGKDFDSMES